MPKTILITGATGKQGTALIQKLSAFPSDFEIFGVTRNAQSARSRMLISQYPSLKLINGSLEKPDSLFKAVPSGVWGVFCVQPALVSGLNPRLEIIQGKALIDTCLANGVSHFVYSSVHRRSETESGGNGTFVPHFDSKFQVETYLKQQGTKASSARNPDTGAALQASSPGIRRGMTYTILRLPIFMENFSNNFAGRATATVWKMGLDPSRKLQIISTADIAHYAHASFSKSSIAEYRNKVLSLAGDEITYSEANRLFRERFGRDLPATYDAVGRFMFWAVKELEIMIRWFNEGDGVADVEKLRKDHPDMSRFKDWLEMSQFAQC